MLNGLIAQFTNSARPTGFWRLASFNYFLEVDLDHDGVHHEE
jgi:hypothetical protein